MPRDASDHSEPLFIRALILGDPKVGKTTTIVKGAVEALGPGYVICCSTEGHLSSAKREVPSGWQYDVVKNVDQMDAALKTYRAGVKEGRYKWGLLDDFNLYAMGVEDAMLAGGGYKPTLYQQLRQSLLSTVLRMADVKAHLFCTCHYFEVGDGEALEGQSPKKGKGVLPLMPGQSRTIIPAQFNQVIWMQREKKGDGRVFCINPEGVWGVGSQGLPKGTVEMPADVGALAKALAYNEVEKKDEK